MHVSRYRAAPERVIRQTLNAARRRAPSRRSFDDQALLEQIRQAQRKHRGRYGRRRMTREVNEGEGRAVNHKRVGRLMREHGLQSRKRRRFRVVMTDSKHAHPVVPNVLARDFEASAPNQKWLADLTYVPTDEGWRAAADAHMQFVAANRDRVRSYFQAPLVKYAA